MTWNPARPCYMLKIGSKDYEIEGTFELIEAVEATMRESIVTVYLRCTEMPVNQMARMLSVMLSVSGTKITPNEVGQILWSEVGLSSTDYTLLCLHVHALLKISLAKPQDREAVKTDMGELLDRWSSLGATTKGFVSASSTGRRKSSGKQRHGT